MRLIVFGGTGRTGQQVLRQALSRGDEVTTVVRDRARLSEESSRLHVVQVRDLGETEAFRTAVAAADAVLSTIGPRSRKDAPVAAPATRAILAAVPAGGTRIVVISAAPVGAPNPHDGFVGRRLMFPMIRAALRPVYDDLASMEGDLAASTSAWTALRPPRLTDGRLTTTYRTAIGASVPRSYTLSRADLAHAMLAVLERPETEGRAVGVAS